MRRLLIQLLLLIAAASAQVTPNIGLNTPSHGAPNWDTLLNANFVTLDGLFPCLTAAHAAGTISYWNGTSVQCLAGNTSGNMVLGEDSSGVPSWVVGGAVTSVFGQTGAVPNLSGDVTTSGSSVTTLATVNSNVGSFTSANVTVDGKGRITAAANGSSAAGTMVNLLAAGAVCNGSNDDTAAIQAAYASLAATYGGSIYWPPAGKECVLTGTVTLANTQATYIHGGRVTWKGTATNTTTGTAAESGNVVTLTTTSGNWPAAFAVNASIKVASCSVAGYNGLAQIKSGGAGGTTLTYIAKGVATGLGAATGCSAGVLPPVFIYDENGTSTTDGFRIGGSTTFPIGAAFSITQDSTYGVVSQGNIFTGNLIDGAASGGLNIGFEIAHGTSPNPTNDEHKFYGNNIYHYSTAGFVIDFFQSVDTGFYSNTCYGDVNVSLACVIDVAGAGFNWTGGFTAADSLADFYGFGQTAHPITIDSVGSEGSKRLAWISQTNQTPTGAPCPVNLMNVRFSTDLANADGHAVIYECPGPLNVIGGSFGQFAATAVDICWCSTYVSGENYAFGSIIGVDSSANNSLAHPLLSIPFADASTIINIPQGGNIYTKSDQGGAPPTTPDLSYNAAHVLPGFGNTYNLGSATFPWANTFKVTDNLVDPSFGSKQTGTSAACETAYATTTLATGAASTDTGLNCLPANAIIDAVVYRITTTITTSANFTIGDATIAGRFCGTQSTLTAGTTGVCFVQADQTGTSGPRQTAAAKVRVTLNANPGAGAIRLIVFYHTWTPPTS